jgi:hypothetical protein
MVRHPNLLLGGMRGTGVSGHRRLQALQAFQKHDLQNSISSSQATMTTARFRWMPSEIILHVFMLPNLLLSGKKYNVAGRR